MYADFQKFVHEQKDLNIESPFGQSLELLQTVLKQNGYEEAQGHASTLSLTLSLYLSLSLFIYKECLVSLLANPLRRDR